MRCRPISRVPAHAQTTLQVKTEFLAGIFDTFGTTLTGFIGTIIAAWDFGSKRTQGTGSGTTTTT